jgi:hypothetical protein
MSIGRRLELPTTGRGLQLVQQETTICALDNGVVVLWRMGRRWIEAGQDRNGKGSTVAK